MLGKLMQYEIKSCGRIFFPFYIMGLIFSLIAALFINFDNYEHNFSVLYIVGIFAGLALFIAAIVLTILLIVQRFNKGLLEDEGYLMFTLPVSQKTLVLSKFLTSLLFIILTSIVGMICIALVSVMVGYKMSDVIENVLFIIFISTIYSSVNFILYFKLYSKLFSIYINNIFSNNNMSSTKAIKT